MKVLIVGASGKIGSTLLKSLLETGVDCFGTTRKLEHKNLIYVDAMNLSNLKQLLMKYNFNVVVNALSSGVVRGSSNWQDMFTANVLYANVLAEAVLTQDDECKLIHLSSAIEAKLGGFAESDYALTKSWGTQSIRQIFRHDPSKCSVVKLHNVYSTSPLPGRFITRLFESALKEEEFEIRHPQRVRDFCLLEEVVENLKNMILSSKSSPLEIEIGTSEGVALEYVAKLVYKLMGTNQKYLKCAYERSPDPNPHVVAGHDSNTTLKCLTKIEDGLAKVKAGYQ